MTEDRDDKQPHDGHHRYKRGPAPAARTAEGGYTPAQEEGQPQPLQEHAERTWRREREEDTLLVEDPVVRVQLSEPAHGLRRREAGAHKEGPEAACSAPDHSDPQPAADVATARPCGANQDGDRRER